MSKHTDRTNTTTSLASMAMTALGALVAIAPLVLLGRAFSDFFGHALDSGGTQAWTFCSIAFVGVLACVLVIVTLAVRCLRELGFFQEKSYRPRRPAARRRRAR